MRAGRHKMLFKQTPFHRCLPFATPQDYLRGQIRLFPGRGV